ncbi:titin, partial [Aplysia californica]|uniref:Titin n=1 Tax=Aplysia californica TaxID=6500 RepID=A0ABM1W370_APLCA
MLMEEPSLISEKDDEDEDDEDEDEDDVPVLVRKVVVADEDSKEDVARTGADKPGPDDVPDGDVNTTPEVLSEQTSVVKDVTDSEEQSTAPIADGGATPDNVEWILLPSEEGDFTWSRSEGEDLRPQTEEPVGSSKEPDQQTSSPTARVIGVSFSDSSEESGSSSSLEFVSFEEEEEGDKSSPAVEVVVGDAERKTSPPAERGAPETEIGDAETSSFLLSVDSMTSPGGTEAGDSTAVSDTSLMAPDTSTELDSFVDAMEVADVTDDDWHRDNLDLSSEATVDLSLTNIVPDSSDDVSQDVEDSSSEPGSSAGDGFPLEPLDGEESQPVADVDSVSLLPLESEEKDFTSVDEDTNTPLTDQVKRDTPVSHVDHETDGEWTVMSADDIEIGSFASSETADKPLTSGVEERQVDAPSLEVKVEVRERLGEEQAVEETDSEKPVEISCELPGETPVQEKDTPALDTISPPSAEESPVSREDARVSPEVLSTDEPTTGAVALDDAGETDVTGVDIETPVSPEETPVTVEETSVSVEETPVSVEETSVSVEETPVTVEETPVSVEETPVTVEETPVTVEETPVTVEETPVTVEETPVSVEETPVSPEETPVSPEETPVTFEETPVTVEETPVSVEETPVSVEETPVSPEETDVVEETHATRVDVDLSWSKSSTVSKVERTSMTDQTVSGTTTEELWEESVPEILESSFTSETVDESLTSDVEERKVGTLDEVTSESNVDLRTENGELEVGADGQPATDVAVVDVDVSFTDVTTFEKSEITSESEEIISLTSRLDTFAEETPGYIEERSSSYEIRVSKSTERETEPPSEETEVEVRPQIERKDVLEPEDIGPATVERVDGSYTKPEVWEETSKTEKVLAFTASTDILGEEMPALRETLPLAQRPWGEQPTSEIFPSEEDDITPVTTVEVKVRRSSDATPDSVLHDEDGAPVPVTEDGRPTSPQTSPEPQKTEVEISVIKSTPAAVTTTTVAITTTTVMSETLTSAVTTTTVLASTTTAPTTMSPSLDLDLYLQPETSVLDDLRPLGEDEIVPHREISAPRHEVIVMKRATFTGPRRMETVSRLLEVKPEQEKNQSEKPMVNIDISVNEQRAEQIFKRLAMSREVTSMVTMRESSVFSTDEEMSSPSLDTSMDAPPSTRDSSLGPDSGLTPDEYLRTRRPSLRRDSSLGPDSGLTPDEYLRTRRPSLRRDSETVIRETLVPWTPQELAETEDENDNVDDDGTVMQINISFDGMEKRLSSERFTASQERTRRSRSKTRESSEGESEGGPLDRSLVSESMSSLPEDEEESDDVSEITKGLKIPVVTVESEAEDEDGAGRMEETVLEVAKIVTVTIRSDKVTKNVSDISIKLGAKGLGSGTAENPLTLPDVSSLSDEIMDRLREVQVSRSPSVDRSSLGIPEIITEHPAEDEVCGPEDLVISGLEPGSETTPLDTHQAGNDDEMSHNYTQSETSTQSEMSVREKPDERAIDVDSKGEVRVTTYPREEDGDQISQEEKDADYAETPFSSRETRDDLATEEVLTGEPDDRLVETGDDVSKSDDLDLLQETELFETSNTERETVDEMHTEEATPMKSLQKGVESGEDVRTEDKLKEEVQEATEASMAENASLEVAVTLFTECTPVTSEDSRPQGDHGEITDLKQLKVEEEFRFTETQTTEREIVPESFTAEVTLAEVDIASVQRGGEEEQEEGQDKQTEEQELDDAEEKDDKVDDETVLGGLPEESGRNEEATDIELEHGSLPESEALREERLVEGLETSEDVPRLEEGKATLDRSYVVLNDEPGSPQSRTYDSFADDSQLDYDTAEESFGVLSTISERTEDSTYQSTLCDDDDDEFSEDKDDNITTESDDTSSELGYADDKKLKKDEETASLSRESIEIDVQRDSLSPEECSREKVDDVPEIQEKEDNDSREREGVGHMATSPKDGQKHADEEATAERGNFAPDEDCKSLPEEILVREVAEKYEQVDRSETSRGTHESVVDVSTDERETGGESLDYDIVVGEEREPISDLTGRQDASHELDAGLERERESEKVVETEVRPTGWDEQMGIEVAHTPRDHEQFVNETEPPGDHVTPDLSDSEEMSERSVSDDSLASREELLEVMEDSDAGRQKLTTQTDVLEEEDSIGLAVRSKKKKKKKRRLMGIKEEDEEEEEDEEDDEFDDEDEEEEEEEEKENERARVVEALYERGNERGVPLDRSVDGEDARLRSEEVLAEKEESLSEKEKLVTAEVEKEAESDEDKKEISPLPTEQAVVEEVPEELFAPVVKQRLTTITTTDGGQARFETEIVGLPTPSITWYKDEQVLQPSEEFEIAYSQENVASLFIHDVLPEDAGKYVVVAKNDLGTATTSANLEVEAAEVSDQSAEEVSSLAPVFTLTPTFQNVDENETAIFKATVEAVPQPQILWSKDNQPIEEDSRVTTSFSPEGDTYQTSLTLADVTPEDAGTFKVTASNDIGEESVTVSLIVNKTQEEKTDFRDQLTAAVVEVSEETQPTEEQVDFRGVLQTEVRTRVGVHFETEQQDFRHLLKSTRIKSKKFTTDVDAEATVSEEVPEVEQVDFRAVLQKPEEQAPEEVFEVQAPEEVLEVQAPEEVLEVQVPEEVLEVQAPEEVLEVQVPEEVREAPEFIRPIEDVNVREGEPARFECQVKGEPAPTVVWFHDQQPIKSDAVYQVVPGDNGQFTLLISEAFPEDSGVYTARAVNDEAEVECSATLTVEEVTSETSSVVSKEDKPEEEDVLSDVIQTEAAIKIQSAFRGFKAREEVKNLKESRVTSEITVDTTVTLTEDQERPEREDVEEVGQDTEQRHATEIQLDFQPDVPSGVPELVSVQMEIPSDEKIDEDIPEQSPEEVVQVVEDEVPEKTAVEVTDEVEEEQTPAEVSVESVVSVVEVGKDEEVTSQEEVVPEEATEGEEARREDEPESTEPESVEPESSKPETVTVETVVEEKDVEEVSSVEQEDEAVVPVSDEIEAYAERVVADAAREAANDVQQLAPSGVEDSQPETEDAEVPVVDEEKEETVDETEGPVESVVLDVRETEESIDKAEDVTETIQVDIQQEDVSPEKAEEIEEIPEDYSAFEETVDQLLKEQPSITSEQVKVEPVEEDAVSGSAQDSKPVVEEAEAEIEVSQPVIEEIEDEIEVSKPEIEKVEAEIEVSKPEIEEVEAEIEISKPVVEEVEAEIEVDQPEIEEVEAEIEISKPVVEEVEAEIEETQPVVEEIEAEIEVSKPVVEEVQAEIEETQPVVEEVEAEIEETQPVVEEVEAEIEETQPVVEEVEAEIDVTQPVVEDVETEIEVSKPEIEEVEAEIEITQPVVEEVEAEIEVSKPVIEEVEAEIEVSKPVVEEVEAEIEVTQPVVEEVEAEIEVSKPEVEEVEAEIEITQPVVEEVEAEIEVSKPVIEEVEAEIEVSKPVVEEVEAEIEVTQPVVEEVEAEIEVSKPEVEEVEAEIEITQPVVEEVEAEIEVSKPVVEEVEAEIEDSKPVVEEVEAEIEVGKPEIEEVEAEIDVTQPVVEEVEAEIEISKPVVEEVEAEIEVSKPVVEEVEAEIEVDQPVVEEVEAEIEVSKPEIEEVEAEIEVTQPVVEEVEAEIEVTQPVVEEVEAEIEVSKPDIEEVEAEIEVTQPVVEEVEAEIEMSEPVEEDTESEMEVSKPVIEDIESDFEVGVESALEDTAQEKKKVFVEDEVDADKDIDESEVSVSVVESAGPDLSDTSVAIPAGPQDTTTSESVSDLDTPISADVMPTDASVPEGAESDFTVTPTVQPTDVEAEFGLREDDKPTREVEEVDVEVEKSEPVSEEVTVDVTFGPQFISELKDQEVNEGDTVTLEVTATGAPQPDVKWFRDEAEISPDERHEVNEVDTTYSLTIRDVTEEDDAEYTVTATNAVGSVSTTAEVFVNPAGEAPKFVTSLVDVTVDFSAPIVLEAKVKGEPKPEVTWLFNGKEIIDTRYKVEYVEDTVRLTIERSESVDAGEFTVTLTNKHGTTSSTANVTVTMVAPTFTLPLADTRVKVSDTADLRCEVTGIPRPEVQWLANDQLIEDSPKYETVYKDTAAILRVKDVTPEDSEVTFTCRASNPAGEATTSARLLPQVPARILTKPEAVAVLEGETIEVVITIEGSPEPTAEWSVNGHFVVQDDRHHISVTSNTVTLTIPASQVTDTATYSLTVTNDVGSDTTTVDVTVTRPEKEISPEEAEVPETRPEGRAPEFVLTIQPQTVTPGETADFTCQVTGEPTPE